MIELIADRDEELMESFIASSGAAITPELLRAALRRLSLASTAVPVLCGASFRNKGVQPLLDSVTHYLPSPSDRPSVEAVDEQGKTVMLNPNSSDDTTFCALAFKVVHHHQRGLLVYFRVYSGRITPGTVLHNTTLNKKVSTLVSLTPHPHIAKSSQRADSF